MKPYQERVVQEKAELDEKLAKLHEFNSTNKVFFMMDQDERNRLLRQRVVMQEYSDILGARIAAFKEQEV